MSLLDPLLFGGKTAGIFRTVLLNPTGISDATSAVQSRGWDSVLVDGTQVDSKATFITTLAEQLHFPSPTTNWDAFEDWLTDLSWQAVESRVIIWTQPERLQTNDPKAFTVALQILSDAVEYWANKGSHLSVVLTTDNPLEGTDYPALG